MTKPLTYELRLTFKGQLPMRLAESLGAQFTAAVDARTAIAKTSLANISSYVDHAKFAEELSERISIFIVEDVNTLRIHTEKTRAFDPDGFNMEIADLKKHAKQRLESMHRFAGENSNKISSAQITISFGKNPISFANESNFRYRLNSKGKSNLASRFSVPVSSALVGFALTQTPGDVMKATLTGIAAALVSVFVEAYSEDSLKYESVS